MNYQLAGIDNMTGTDFKSIVVDKEQAQLVSAFIN